MRAAFPKLECFTRPKERLFRRFPRTNLLNLSRLLRSSLDTWHVHFGPACQRSFLRIAIKPIEWSLVPRGSHGADRSWIPRSNECDTTGPAVFSAYEGQISASREFLQGALCLVTERQQARCEQLPRLESNLCEPLTNTSCRAGHCRGGPAFWSLLVAAASGMCEFSQCWLSWVRALHTNIQSKPRISLGFAGIGTSQSEIQASGSWQCIEIG